MIADQNVILAQTLNSGVCFKACLRLDYNGKLAQINLAQFSRLKQAKRTV